MSNHITNINAFNIGLKVIIIYFLKGLVTYLNYTWKYIIFF